MKNINLSWDILTIAEAGGAPTVKAMRHVAVSLSADLGANFSFLANVAPPETTFLIADMEAGDYVIRTDVVDIDGDTFASIDTPVNITDETLPGSITNVAISLT